MVSPVSQPLAVEDGVRATFRSFVGGAPFDGAGSELTLTDPATAEPWGSVVIADEAADAALAAAARVVDSGAWSQRQPWERADVLRRLGALLARHADELGRYETLANGKPLTTTLAEVAALERWFTFFAAAAETADDRFRTLGGDRHAMVVEEPLGVVLAISPYNAALSLGSWKVAPALAAGNAVVLKPPPTAAASSVRLAELAVEAGLPEGVLNVVIGDGGVGERLARDPRVALVSFTGSTPVAARLASGVGARMGRCVCEAGGKSAQVVFADADLDATLVGVTQGAFSAAGQTCVAGSRILVDRELHAEFRNRLVARIERLTVGDPRDPGTHVGPLGTDAQVTRVEGFVRRAVEDGARVVTGGTPPVMPARLSGGHWFAPTLLENVRPEMEICREEVFGPVCVLQTFDSESEALALANRVDYGLAAGVWSRDGARAARVARRLQAGTVWVNGYRAIDWRVPFGGYKQSGLGRENGIETLREYTQTKAVIVDLVPAPDPFRLAG